MGRESIKNCKGLKYKELSSYNSLQGRLRSLSSTGLPHPSAGCAPILQHGTPRASPLQHFVTLGDLIASLPHPPTI